MKIIRNTALLGFTALAFQLSYARDVIAPADPSITSHTLSYKGSVLGIAENAGGMINRFRIDGSIDLMGPEVDRAGRGGQIATRDKLHRLRYNPTQAGFHEYLGTPSDITVSQGGTRLTVNDRPCALWHGDGRFDYIRWENIGADPYGNDGGDSDVDGIDEENLEGKQNTEVKSEFNFWAEYKLMDTEDWVHDLAVFRCSTRFSYVRDPIHCIRQFNKVYSPHIGNITDMSNHKPDGVHPDHRYDLANQVSIFAMRFDRDRSPFTHTRWINENGDWMVRHRTGGFEWRVNIENNEDVRSRSTVPWDGGDRDTSSPHNFDGKRLIVLAQSALIGGPLKALGIYTPDSGKNKLNVIGRDRGTGKLLYRDRRVYGMDLADETRTASLEKAGVNIASLGVMNPGQLIALNAYESVRHETYLLVGNPKQIREVVEQNLEGL
ncbi:hypothetical protein [Pelagicoccus sp. SDUM812005]|nr:hypothetical protein [Pelagicoccus sp. SDUM812005]MDQ8181136.1 hypothetical protein [Pelagicoccus sp. SDUM812005]